MAKAETTGPKRRRLKTKPPSEPPPEGSVAVEESPDSTEEPAPEDPAQNAAPPKRKLASRSLTFFQFVGRIAKPDWGTRAKITVYRLEPIIDRLRGSNVKYIMVYHEPVDEERIKIDHGSGRYRLMLTYKKPAADKSDEMDTIEFDILDKNFPPKIPAGDWVDDPRNDKWAWAKAAPVAAVAPGANVLDTMRVLNEIRKDAREEMRPPEQPERPSAAEELNTVLSVAERIADAKKPPPQDNTVLTLVTGQIDALRTELADARKRNDALMDKLIDAKGSKEDGGIKGLAAAIKELEPVIEKFLPPAKDAIESVTRGRNTPWYAELGIELARQSGPLFQMFAQVAAMKAMQAQQPSNGNGVHPSVQMPPPALPGAVSQPQPAPAGIDIDAMILNAIDQDADGGAVAGACNLLPGGSLLYKQICSLGEEGIIEMLKKRPVWERLGALQAKIPEFVKDFIDWGRDEEEIDSEPSDNPIEPVDLTGGTI